MFRILICLKDQHDWRLVLLAAAICFLACFAAVALFHSARAHHGRTRWIWVATAGIVTGSGIWATHFIAVLAYQPDLPTGFDIGRTATSLMLAILLTSSGLVCAISFSRASAIAGGAIIGAGIASMHYIGMSALMLSGRIVWSFDLVAVSIVIGMILGAAAISVAIRSGTTTTTIVATTLLALAIVSHHFTGMGAMTIVPDPTRVIEPFSIAPPLLAAAIAAVEIFALAITLLCVRADRRMAAQARFFEREHRLLAQRSAEEIAQHNFRLDTALQHMVQGLAMFDAQQRLTVCNARFLELFGLAPDQAKPDTRFADLLENSSKSGETPNTALNGAMHDLVRLVEERASAKILVELSDARVFALAHEPTTDGGWVVTFEDVSDRRRMEHMAYHDTLTNLPNRAAFADHLAATLQRAATKNEAFAVLCLDLDRFKEANDFFGHAVGDALLRAVSDRLTQAAPDLFVARVGGDEFTLVSPVGVTAAAIVATTERLLDKIGQEFLIDDNRLRIGASIGVAIHPTDGTDEATLIANADAALYRAKTGGGHAASFFESRMDRRLSDRHGLHCNIRWTLSRAQKATENAAAVAAHAQASVDANVRAPMN